MPEGETIIRKKNSTGICFEDKIANKDGEGFLLTTKFYKSENNADLLAPKKSNMEGKAAKKPERTVVKKQKNTTAKQTETQKFHTKELRSKISHLREDMMHATLKHLQRRIKGTLNICEDCAKAKTKQKSLQKLAEERNLEPGEIIYIDIISQKKPSYGGSKNWILIQDCDTKQKWYFCTKKK